MVFHIRLFGCGRAFHRPPHLLAAAEMFFRGWRPFSTGGWWSKPSKMQKAFEVRSLKSMTEADFDEVHNR